LRLLEAAEFLELSGVYAEWKDGKQPKKLENRTEHVCKYVKSEGNSEIFRGIIEV